MADAQFLYAERASDITSATTAYVDAVILTGTAFTANKKYLIIGNSYVQCNNATNDLKIRMIHGTGTVFEDGSGDYEVTANVQRTNAGWMYVYTQPATPEEIRIQIANISTSTTTAVMAQIYAIKLDDDFTENTDYFYNEVTGDYTTTTTMTAQASVTFTPNGTDDWLIIGNACVQPGSATTPYRMTLYNSVDAADAPNLELEGEDTTNERREHLVMRVWTPTAVSNTFSVRFNHTTTAATVHSSRIFAINLNKFAQHVFAYTAAADIPSATPTWETEQTVSITPDTTGDFFIWGYLTDNINSSGEVMYCRLQVAGASNPNYGDDAPSVDGWDSSDQTPFNIGTITSLSSGGARTINLDCSLISGTTLTVQERCLVVFSKALAAGAPVANTKRSFGFIIG